MEAYVVGFILILMAAVGGIFIGLSGWFDRLMKQIGDKIEKISIEKKSE